MQRGPQTRSLHPAQIKRLEKFRRASHEGAPHGYSLPLLRTAMGASFGWQTLKKALAGRPVLELHHSYITQWIERYLEEPPAVRSGKDAASGERDDPEIPSSVTDPKDDHSCDPLKGRRMDSADVENEGTTPPTGTVRGSR